VSHQEDFLQIELFVHSALPGKVEPLLRLWREVWVPVRERHGAKLLFACVGDSGPMGEVVMAWAYPSADELTACSRAIQADPQLSAVVAEVSTLLRAQSRRLLEKTWFSTLNLPPEGTRLIDLRCYTFRPGGLAPFLPICASEGLPRQRRHCGALVFHATSLTGSTEDLVQAWAYENHDEYDQGQRALFRDPDWSQNYRQKALPLVEVQDHRYLQTLSWSPVQTST
jgi:NIPSNAP